MPREPGAASAAAAVPPSGRTDRRGPKSCRNSAADSVWSADAAKAAKAPAAAAGSGSGDAGPRRRRGDRATKRAATAGGKATRAPSHISRLYGRLRCWNAAGWFCSRFARPLAAVVIGVIVMVGGDCASRPRQRAAGGIRPVRPRWMCSRDALASPPASTLGRLVDSRILRAF